MVKDIIITNRCQVLTSRGICLGPVITPFKEHISYIFGMVCDQGACIEEVLRDGSTIKLDVFNYDKDNQPTIVEKKEEKSHNPALVQEKKSSELDDKINEEATNVVGELVKEETESVIDEVQPEPTEGTDETAQLIMDGEDAAEENNQQRQQTKQNYYKKNKNKK